MSRKNKFGPGKYRMLTETTTFISFRDVTSFKTLLTEHMYLQTQCYTLVVLQFMLLIHVQLYIEAQN